jgi:hypothetical protein
MSSRDPKKPKGGYALVSNQGPFRETVVGCFKTHEAAVTEMRKRGGEPASLFTAGLRVVDVTPESAMELVYVLTEWSIRPKNRGMPKQ